MSRLLLFIYLNPDETNTAEGMIASIEKEEKRTLFSHDGVTRLRQDVYLFDETKAHGLLSILCATAQKRGRAYLLLQLEATSSLLAGTPAKDIQDTLKKIGVPFCPSL